MIYATAKKRISIIVVITSLLLLIIGIIDFILDIVSAIYRMKTDRRINIIADELNLSNKYDKQ